ncbi:hypothetical protein [Neobacillus sp. D3-1R]|uniref:hypothetical protein n=1 Tax=Neobacillus sp. D3-1R TaxID=3445778 RepID=UPI003F9EE755
MKMSKKGFSRFFFFSLVFLLFFSISAEAAATKLPIFFKDPVNCDRCGSQLASAPNGVVYQYLYDSSKINAISSSGKKLWTYKLPKTSYLSYKTGGTIDSKGNLYFGFEKNSQYYLAKLNSKGGLTWAYKLDNPYGPGAPIIDKVGNVYFGSGNPTDSVGPFGKSNFYAVSPKGKKLWSVNINGDSIFGTIQFDKNQNLVFPSTNDELVWNYTISKAGKVLSSKETFSYSNKVWSDYFIDVETSTLKALDKKGKTLWSYKVTEDTSIEYVTSTGTVFLSSGGNILSISKGKLNWKVKAMGDFNYHQKGLFIVDKFSGNMLIKVLDEKSGKVKLSKQLDSDFYEYTILPNGTVMVSKQNLIYKVTLFK